MLVLETNVTPPIPVDLFGSGEASEGDGGGLLALLRPRVSGTLPLVGAVDYAPYGAPVEGLGGLVFVGVLGLAAVGAYYLVRRGR